MKRNFAQLCTSDEFKASHRWWRLKKMKLLQNFKKNETTKKWKCSSQNDALAAFEALWLDNEEREGKSDGRLQFGHCGKFSWFDDVRNIFLIFCIYICIFAASICICIWIFAAWPNPLKIASQQWQPRGPGERDPTSKQCGQVHIVSTLYGWINNKYK